MTYKDIQIVYEDNCLLVAVKPYNVPVQEDESGDEDMLSMLKQYLVEKYNKPGDAYLGLVHRLDRPTGGVMVFAKNSKTAARLSEAIRDGGIEKRYLAVVEGAPRYRADKLMCYLKKDPATNTVRIAPALTEGAKYAELDYKLLSTQGDMSLLQVNLVTGRAHQIRVQLANMGNPIVGDKKYGHGEGKKGEMALWACQLKLAHPVSGKDMVFRVYPPEISPWTRFDLDVFLNVNIKNSD